MLYGSNRQHGDFIIYGRDFLAMIRPSVITKNESEEDLNMRGQKLTAGSISAFADHLRREEKSGATIEKYLRNVRDFAAWLAGEHVSAEKAAEWKAHLSEEAYRPATINGAMAALNALFRFLGWNIKTKYLTTQRRTFRDDSRELTKPEYKRLVSVAYRLGREQLALVMETICATGIRVSEVRYITVEAAHAGRTEIRLKGKIRTILLPSKLCRKLMKYAQKNRIASGEIFLAESGKPMSRNRIWGEMKRICREAGVESAKVFPHNLRHLFAATFYSVCRDIVHLADVLGHSSIETTRIYLLTSGREHQQQLNRLELVL